MNSVIRFRTFGALVLLLATAMLLPANLRAQGIASIHGHAQNAAGFPVTGEVKLTTDRTAPEKERKYQYTGAVDKNGDYKITGIKPGLYLAILFVDVKQVDFADEIKLDANVDKAVNFDMTRKEYIEKMTPEEKKAVEDFKKKNAEVMATNAKVGNLNNLLKQARDDIKAGNPDAAFTAMSQATAAKPDESVLWVELGNSQLGQADGLAANLKKEGKSSMSDATVVQKYNDAVASFKKAIELNAASKKPSTDISYAANVQMGQAEARLGNVKDSIDAFDRAATILPNNAGAAYYNEAAIFYNNGKMDDAAAAADKAIASDPTKAEAYYIKGQAVIGKSTVDPKTQKIVPPPGCLEAYEKYLELTPNGPHAADVKQIIAAFDEKIVSNYKSGKKK